jgi:hypothetical protein
MVGSAGAAFATALLWTLLGFGLAVPVLLILNAWIVEETLSPAMAFGALAALLVAFYAIWSSQGTVWVFLWIAVMVAACAALPLVTRKANRRALRQMAYSRISGYLSAIARDPKIAAAYAYLGDAYMECGRLEEAIRAYEKAIELDPIHSHRERAKLREAQEAKQGRTRSSILVCDVCRGEFPVGPKACVHCGARVRMSFFEWLAQPESIKAVTRQTVVVMLVLMILYAVFSTLPLEVKGCVIIASLFVGAFCFLRGIGGG